MLSLRLPNITATDEVQQLSQIRSYLYQLTEQLNIALVDVDKQITTVTEVSSASPSEAASVQEQDSLATFNSIKSLIIKSADIVNAYYDTINAQLAGVYVAQSDYGTFKTEANASITANANGIAQLFTNVQRIDGIVNQQLSVQAYIHTGELYIDPNTGYPVFGVEVGQTNTEGGVEVFSKFARFTADRLSFYDNNDIEVAYVSDSKLYITHAEITGTLKLGNYILDTSDGLAFLWEEVSA